MNEQANISNNTEIDKALREFGAGSSNKSASKAPEVSKTSSIPQNNVEGVTFEVPSYKAVKDETGTPRIVKLVTKWFGLKEEKQAEYVLLAFVVLAILVSLYLFFGVKSASIIRTENFENKPQSLP